MTVQHASQLLFSSAHPLTTEFDLKFIECADHVLAVSVLAPQSYAGSKDDGLVHSSFTTLFLDTVMGSCVLGELDQLQPIATVNLSVNHVQRPTINDVIVCRARFNGQIHDVAHVSCDLVRQTDNALLATGSGTFMIGTRGRPLGENSHEISSQVNAK